MISYYLSILRRRVLLVVAITAVMAPLIAVALTAGPQTYSSEAVIEVGTGSVTDDLVDSSRPFNEPERRIATELEVLTGRAVAEGAAERLADLGQDVSVDELVSRVEAAPRGGASAIGVIGIAPEPREAQQLTEAFVDSYFDYRRTVDRAELERVQSDLQERAAETLAEGDSQSRYDTLSQWLEAVNLRLSVDTSGLSLISPPTLPTEPTTSVSPLVAVVVANIGALLLACGAALLLDLARGSVRTREDAESLLLAPALVEMPRVRDDARAWNAALSDPSHPVRAAARGLRLRLGGSAAHGGARRLMLVGTERDSLDTFTVAAALAAAYGRSDLRVLLIADPVKDIALSQLSTTDADIDVAVDTPVVRQTSLKGVWVSPATSWESGQPGLLDAFEPAKTLNTFSMSFDAVIVAMPPSPGDAEAVAIGRLMQATVVICALGRTNAKQLRRLVAALERNEAVISGLALTTKGRLRQRPASSDSSSNPGRVPVDAA